MKDNFHKVLKLFVLFIPVTILLNSCGRDFKSVENFVKNHQVAIKNSSDLLAQDIYESCLRRGNYIILTASNGIETRENTLQECNSQNKPNRNRVKIANSVLLNYMTELGQVASGKTVSFDENISDLQTALINLKVGSSTLPKTTIQAGINVFQIFVNTLSKEKRGKALKKAILCADDSLQSYITGNSTFKDNQQQNGGLISIAQDGYLEGILEIEETQINNYYQTYFAPLREFNESQITREFNESQITVALEVQKDYQKAMKIVQDKKDNAQDYIDILLATAKAHSRLKDVFKGTGKDAISSEEIKQLCQSVLVERENDLEKNNQSSKLDLTESEMIKAQEILSEYSQTVKYLQKNRTL
ncbi:hypothetical protein WA1_40855 [Scytonema hofmannii PCC 7110]|uniref:Uncharacterized protein n=1 Tax=Scytonema hofmannii PCC 7110 TaxID=128403 RepID=A0A139WUH8_9CYAN|nr:hypothetical protein [Scytonema hofmannii]KYC36092.1 hypothetical protein WA1_40855 [Scytonema hofmannii PCC 7110]